MMTTQEQQDVQAAEEAPVTATDAETSSEAATEAVAVDAEATEVAEDAAEGEEESAVEVNPNFRWYVVHTYSGYENRAKASLEERIKQKELDAEFGEVLIPTENVVELGKGGTKRTSKRKFFPGYMLVQMEHLPLHLIHRQCTSCLARYGIHPIVYKIQMSPLSEVSMPSVPSPIEGLRFVESRLMYRSRSSTFSV